LVASCKEMSRGADIMNKIKRIECSMILIDLSGFTQLLYYGALKPEIMSIIINGVEQLFRRAHNAVGEHDSIQIINTTGDGFIAVATNDTPSRTALTFAQTVKADFMKFTRPTLLSIPFRQVIELRIALHHGCMYELLQSEHEHQKIYIGDDLNLLARIVNSQIARLDGWAISRAFYKRLMLVGKTKLKPDEVILDRNKYPEQIEIYKLPATIPEHDSRRK